MHRTAYRKFIRRYDAVLRSLLADLKEPQEVSRCFFKSGNASVECHVSRESNALYMRFCQAVDPKQLFSIRGCLDT